MLSFHQFRILSRYLSKYCLFPILFTASRAPNQVFASSHSVIQGPQLHTLSSIFWLLASVTFWIVPLERFLFLFWKRSVFLPNLLGLFWLCIAFCSSFYFFFYSLKHFKHSFLDLIIPLAENPGRSTYASCCFCLLLVSSQFGSTFSFCVSVERLCSLSWVWGSLVSFLPCTQESPPLGHVRWISGFEFPGSCSLCEVTPCPCVRAGLWLWDLRSSLPKAEPRSKQKVFLCSLLVT